MTGHVCPACGTPRAADGRAWPGCDCAERAADAVRAERRAEVAAEEDFDPLRIRPYVTLQDLEEPGHEPAAGTVPLPMPLPPGPPVPRPVADDPAETGPAETGPVEPGPVEPGPVELGPVAPDPVATRRRRPFAGIIVAVAVAGTAAFAGGLFSGNDERDRALPDTERSAPSEPSASVAPDAPSSSPSRSVSPSSPSPSPSRTPSATSSSSRTTPSPSGPASPPAPPPPTMRATGAVSQEPEPPAKGTLRLGDSGPEVAELQQRLGEVWLYGGPADGQYGQSVEDAVRAFQGDREVKGDPEGIYGPNTRRALESETREP